jgi:hypothetical protein
MIRDIIEREGGNPSQPNEPATNLRGLLETIDNSIQLAEELGLSDLAEALTFSRRNVQFYLAYQSQSTCHNIQHLLAEFQRRFHELEDLRQQKQRDGGLWVNWHFPRKEFEENVLLQWLDKSHFGREYSLYCQISKEMEFSTSFFVQAAQFFLTKFRSKRLATRILSNLAEISMRTLDFSSMKFVAYQFETLQQFQCVSVRFFHSSSC